MAKRLSIVIPVYNEKETFLALLEQVEKAALPAGIEREIIVVNDASTDGSKEILESAKARFRLITNPENRGKGYSVKRGLEASTGDFVIIQDADLEYDTADYSRLLTPLLENKADVVFGSRFLGGRRPVQMSFLNWVANKVLTWWSNMLTGLRLTDMETCYKVLSRKVVNEVAPRLTSDRFGIEPELTSLVKKFRVQELAIQYKGRSVHEGKKIGWLDGFSSLYDIVKFNTPSFLRKIDWEIWLILGLIVVAVLVFLPPQPAPDSYSLIEAKDVLWGTEPGPDFAPNRLITSPLGLVLIGLLEKIVGYVFVGWFIMNAVFFGLAGYFFYRFCLEVFERKKYAVLSLILFATNYAVVVFGLGFLMDMGGWAGFMGALYFAQKYWRTSELKDLLFASVCIAAGGLIKEYAFFAAIFVACVLIYKHLLKERQWRIFLKRSALSAALAVVPILLVYFVAYFKFGYTYLDWFAFNEVKYPRTGLVELVKVFGSLFTFGWFLFLLGVASWWKLKFRPLLPVIFLFVSTLPLLVWPVTTQRIQFLVLLAPILICGLAVKESRKFWLVVSVLVALCILSAFAMDSYILPSVNIDEILH